MPRWKQGPNGPYYDPNDSGPDQVRPPAQAQAAQNAVGGQYQPPTGGVTGGQFQPPTQAQGGLGAPQAQAVQQAVRPREYETFDDPNRLNHDEPQPPQASGQIQNWYQQYLGRAASDAEVQTHARNPYGMAGVEQTIRGSQEAATRRGQAAPQIQADATGDQQIQAYYRHYLGRDASSQEIQSHLQNPYGMSAVHDTIRGSQEAAARAQAAPAAAAPGGAPQFGAGANFDGFAAPQYVATRAGAHAMPGWDQTKWANADHQTPKYVVGRILSQFDPRTTSTEQAVAEIQRAYPGASFNGKDLLTIPGVGTFDILKGASQGGEAWQFNQVAGPNGQPIADAGGGPGGGFNPAAFQMNQFSNAWLQALLRSLGVGF